MTGTSQEEPGLTNEWAPGTFVIFCHIQKTAGMTVQRYLRKRFGPCLPKRVSWRLRGDPRLSGNIVTAAQARTKGDGFFSGHFCFGMHRHLPSPASYMTFLRDPVKRVVSLYNYSASSPGAYYHGFARNTDLRTFACDSGLMELDNGMVRFLAGSRDDPFINRAPVGTLTERDLTQAKRNLDDFFFFVGVQERFDASFLLLGKHLGDRAPRYLTLNTAKSGPEATGIDTDVLKAIEDRNELDQALYEHARARLDIELQAAFPNLESNLAQLRARNAGYNRRMRALYGASLWMRPRTAHYKA